MRNGGGKIPKRKPIREVKGGKGQKECKFSSASERTGRKGQVELRHGR